jgi:hypothetical protein
MEIIDNYFEGTQSYKYSIIAHYRLWRSHLYKWPAYIANKHAQNKHIDKWSEYVVSCCKNKETIAYASGGLFFKDFLPDVTVVEHYPCPIDIPGLNYLLADENLDNELEDRFDCMIAMNPQPLKYNGDLHNFLVKPGISRAGFKPNISKWIKKDGEIFLSFSDWHMYYDRLKLTTEQFVDQQISKLDDHGFECIYKDVSASTLDVVNGNVKLILKKKF